MIYYTIYSYYRIGHVWHYNYCPYCRMFTLHEDNVCWSHGQGTTAGRPGRE